MSAVVRVLIGLFLLIFGISFTFPPMDSIIVFVGGFLIGYNGIDAYREIKASKKK